VLREIFRYLDSLSTIPEPDKPLIPSMEDLQSHIARKRGENINETVKEEEDVSEELDKEMIYMAITTTDSTVVYYKLSKGIKKPADIPDE
jgi:hypothetical protein